MNRPGSERLRLALSGSVLSGLLSLSEGYLAPWRLEPRPAPAAVLMVGEPTPSLAYRAVLLPG